MKLDGCALHLVPGCTGKPDHFPDYLDNLSTACSPCHEQVCREKEAEEAEAAEAERQLIATAGQRSGKHALMVEQMKRWMALHEHGERLTLYVVRPAEEQRFRDDLGPLAERVDFVLPPTEAAITFDPNFRWQDEQ